MKYREEKDMIGEVEVPSERLWGVHTQRALNNFKVSGEKAPFILIKALATVKKACCLANLEMKYIDPEKGRSILTACDEIIDGKHKEEFPLDALQGGAGTSTNMNVNEVVANRALEIAGKARGEYGIIHPLRDVNMHQSTNDVYPTAVKVALLWMLKDLSRGISDLQGSFQKKEKEFADVIKLGRTEMQAAVPMTLGAEFSAFSEAIARDRWRVFKCEERVRQINLGGTAIGTGLTAPREYIFAVSDKLREITGLPVSRGENTVDQTANSDAFIEVAGMLRAHVSNIIKICNDLRILSLLGEISLDPVQSGSSIMPGKVNPVILECAIQGALKADSMLGLVFECSSRSSLQINEFMPLLSHSFISSMDILKNTDTILSDHIVKLSAEEDVCLKNFREDPVIITALLPHIGYEKAEELIKEFYSDKRTDILGFLSEKIGKEKIDSIFSPGNLMSLGYRHDGKSS